MVVDDMKHPNCTVIMSQHNLMWQAGFSCPECSALEQCDIWRDIAQRLYKFVSPLDCTCCLKDNSGECSCGIMPTLSDYSVAVSDVGRT